MTGREIRVRQRALISAFIANQDFSGCRVLDFGCGDEPHRKIIEAAGGDWVGYNRTDFPGSNEPNVGPDEPLAESWDAIVCAQLLQYVPDVAELLERFRAALTPRGRLILTYATNWPEVEQTDLWRFTKAGMAELLHRGCWQIEQHARLGAVSFGDREEQAHGYGVIASRPPR